MKPITMKTLSCKPIIRLRLPAMASYFCGRHASPMAVAAHPRGNAAGRHGGKAKYGKRERRKNRGEERDAQAQRIWDA